MTPSPNDLVALHLQVPRFLKLELQMEAWRENVPLTQYVRDLIAQRGKWQRNGYDREPPAT
jgi:hypothetical protein